MGFCAVVILMRPVRKIYCLSVCVWVCLLPLLFFFISGMKQLPINNECGKRAFVVEETAGIRLSSQYSFSLFKGSMRTFQAKG